jgi:uncharacterized protein YegL
MKTDYTDISIVLDRSGSMESIRQDAIGSFNVFLQDQKTVPREATITLVQFDDQFEVVYRAIALNEAPNLTPQTFVPRGSTALLDAIGRTIDETGQRLASLPEADRPESVIFVILTDGEENSSRHYSTARINDLIHHQRDVYNWQFVFLGANQDAIMTASRLGIASAQAMTFAASPVGAKAAMGAVSKHLKQRRMKLEASIAFDDEDRKQQEDALKNQ